MAASFNHSRLVVLASDAGMKTHGKGGGGLRRHALTGTCPCANASPCIDSRYPWGHLCVFAGVCYFSSGTEYKVSRPSPAFTRRTPPLSRSHPALNRRPPSKHTPALMTRDRHQRQNGPNRPPCFPIMHHMPYHPPCLRLSLTWGPLLLQEPWGLAHQRAERGLCFFFPARPPWETENPGPRLGSSCARPADLLFLPGPLLSLQRVRGFISR